MRYVRFLGMFLGGVALFGFTGAQTGWAAYSSPTDTTSRSVSASGFDGRFRLAVTGDTTIPALETESASMVPPEELEPEKKKKKKRKTKVSQAPKPKPKPVEKKEEEGFLSKTYDSLFGDDEKKPEPKAGKAKSAKSKNSKAKDAKAEEEEGFLTNALKTLVGEDEEEGKGKAKEEINPLEAAPTVSATKGKDKGHKTKTAKTETKEQLKSSFEQLIGSGDKGDGGKESAPADDAKATQSAKKDDSGSLLGNLLSGDKDDKGKTKQAKVEKAKAKAEPVEQKKPRKLQSRKAANSKAIGSEEEQLEKDRGGVKKDNNLLKESFKSLLDKKEQEGK